MKTKPEVHEKLWGREEWIVNDDKYCGKYLVFNKGYQCSYHYHKLKDETFHIVSGKIFMILNGKDISLNPGETVRIRPNDKHSIVSLEDSTILEISTQHFESDSYRVTQSKMLDEVDLEDFTERFNKAV